MTPSRVSTYLLFIASLLSWSNAFIWRFRVLGASKHCHSVLQFVTRCPAPVTISGWLFLSTLHPMTLSEVHESRSECQNLYQLKSNLFLNGIPASLRREEDQAGQMGFLFFVMLWAGVRGWCNVGGEPQWTTSPSAPFSRSIALSVQWKPTKLLKRHNWSSPIPCPHLPTERHYAFLQLPQAKIHECATVNVTDALDIFGHHLHSPCGHTTQCCLCKKDWRYKVVCCHNQREKYRTLWLSQTHHHSWLPNAPASTKPNQAWTSAMIWWHRHHCKMQELATEQFCSTRLYLAQPPMSSSFESSTWIESP
jgi:hypothetical protein